MEEKDLTNILEQLEVPEVNNPAHQTKLRSMLLQKYGEQPKVKESFSVFDLISNAINMKKLSFAFAIVLLAVLGVFAYRMQFQKPGATPPVAQQNKNTEATSTPELALNNQFKEVQWHDPANETLGYKFDIPNTWVELASTSERKLEVASCQPNTPGCDSVGLSILVSSEQASSYVGNLISGYVASLYGYTQSTTSVAGIPAVLLSNPKYGHSKIIYVSEGNEWFVFELNPGQNNIQDNYILLDKIISTFMFTAKQGDNPPAEYELFKDLDDNWQLTYKLSNEDYNVNKLICVDGKKGNTEKGYVFAMDTRGETQNGVDAGDIDIPSAKVMASLKNDGWTDCGVPLDQQDTSNGTNYVFIKNNKLIGIFKHYSMGVGNSLKILIQYDK